MDFTKELSEKEYQELGRKHVASFKEFFDNDVQGIIQELLDTIGCGDENDIGRTTGLFQVMHYRLLGTGAHDRLTEDFVVNEAAACCFSLLAVQTILDKLCKEKREWVVPLGSRPIKWWLVPKDSYDENIRGDIKYDTCDSPRSGKPYEFIYHKEYRTLRCRWSTLKLIAANPLSKWTNMMNLGTIVLGLNCDSLVNDDWQFSPIGVHLYKLNKTKDVPLKELIEYIDHWCGNVDL